MEKRKVKKSGFILIVCAMLFVSLVLLVILSERKRLDEEFNALVSANLTAYTHIQCNQVTDLIRDVQNSLSAISQMASSPSCTAGDEEISRFLQELGDENEHYQVDYLPLAELEKGSLDAEVSPADAQICQRLLQGEALISDISYSQRLGGYFFGVAQPVIKGGQTAGALRVRVSAALFEDAFHDTSLYRKVLTCVTDADGEILYSNTGAYRSTGNLVASLEADGFSQEDAHAISGLLASHRETAHWVGLRGEDFLISSGAVNGNGWEIVNFLRSPDVLFRSEAMTRRMIFSSCFLILFTAAVSGAMVFTLTRQKRKLGVEQRRYAMLSQFSDTVLFEYCYETDSVEFTPNASQRFLLPELRLEAITSGGRAYTLLHPDDRAVLLDMVSGYPAETQSEQLFYCEVRMMDTKGKYCWHGCQCRYIFSAGAPVLIIGKLVDITDQRSREQALLEQMRRDTLTDTYNKSGEKIINEILTLQSRGLFFMIDLDNFKAINDNYGHAAGDALLSSLGCTLKGIFRSDDVVARIGGDEFVVFIPNSSDKGLAERKAGEILSRIRSLRVEACPELALSVSIGIAVCPDDGADYTQLYAAADKAMYLVKRAQKNGYQFYVS